MSRTRVSAGTFAVVAVTLIAGTAHAELSAFSRMDHSTVAIAGVDRHRIWARNLSGEALSAYDLDGNGRMTWTNHGKADASLVHTYGLAATSFKDAALNNYEYVYYVGTASGDLYEGRILNNGAISWANYPEPAVLTGHLAAATFTYGGYRYVAVVATAAGSTLYRFVRNITLGINGWVNSSGTLSWPNDVPIAATVNPGGTIASFFATHTQAGSKQLGMLRWTGSSWITQDLDAPSGKQVCDSISAAQGLLSSGVFRLDVACTSTDAASNLYVAQANSEITTTFTWNTRSLASAPSISAGNVVASTLREEGANFALDHMVLASGGHLHRVTDLSGGFSSTVDLGDLEDVEPEVPVGGLTAVPDAADFTRTFFIAEQGSLDLLYERAGTSGNTPGLYRAPGTNDDDNVVFSGGQRAEGMLAEWSGTILVSMINRPGTGGSGDWPSIQSARSTSDGDTFGSSFTHSKVVGSQTYNYVTDPTAGMTDGNRGYTVMLGWQLSTCTPTATTTRSAVFLDYTDNGSTYSMPLLVREQTSGTPVSATIDHPFSALQHVGGGADRLHMAWWNIVLGTIEYAYFDDGGSVSSIRTIRTAGTGAFAPRITANDMGEVYVYFNQSGGSSMLICKLNATLDGCLGGWTTLPSQLNVSTTDTFVGGNVVKIRTGIGYSMAASQTETGTVYYCFQQLETDGDGADADSFEEKDVYCSLGLVDGSGVWTWDTTPLRINITANDDRDQFNPEVHVGTEDDQNGDDGMVFISYYDRTLSSTNTTYRPFISHSSDRLATRPGVSDVAGVDSDPANLPRHCKDANVRFIGDYSATAFSRLHTHSLYVTVPSGGGISTDTRQSYRSMGAF